jgi:hypothetical protein
MQISTSTPSTMIATVLAGPAGVDFGNFAGADEAAILDAYAVEMGFASFAALAEAHEHTVEQCRADLRLVPITITRGDAEIDRLWSTGNEAGEGFDPEADDIEAEFERVGVVAGSDAVARMQVGERVLAVAWLNGLWAVDVTELA